MILNLFRKRPPNEAVTAVYRAIVAQSRQPHFYAEWGVPDTVTGRFDMISLHMSLVLHRLRGEGAAASEFSQALFDLFFLDMDRSLREMGAGDLAVPKKVRKMTEIFYALMTGINEAIERNDLPGVEAVLRRNVLADIENADAAALAGYLMAQRAALTAQPVTGITTGTIDMAVAA
jgi:cytochrome b pre-mRNA-processing protein 3